MGTLVYTAAFTTSEQVFPQALGSACFSITLGAGASHTQKDMAL